MPVDALEDNESVHSNLHAYCVHPNVRFESQHSDENVILLIRRHPITFVPWVTTSIVFFLIPFFANIFLANFFTLAEVLFLNLLWYSLLFSYVFISVLSWLFNVGIVTNKRVIDIDYTLIIHKILTGTSIEDITDATAHTSGFIRSLYNYGDVFVQTAGKDQNIDFHAVPHPGNVVSIINRLMR